MTAVLMVDDSRDARDSIARLVEPDDPFPLNPASDAPADQVRDDWAAVRGGG